MQPDGLNLWYFNLWIQLDQISLNKNIKGLVRLKLENLSLWIKLSSFIELRADWISLDNYKLNYLNLQVLHEAELSSVSACKNNLITFLAISVPFKFSTWFYLFASSSWNHLPNFSRSPSMQLYTSEMGWIYSSVLLLLILLLIILLLH